WGAGAGGRGFVGTLERAVGELRAARVTPAELRHAAPRDGPSADLAVLYGEVDGRLRLPHDLAWEAADAASGLGAHPPVAVDGLGDPAPAARAPPPALRPRPGVTGAPPSEPARARD